MQKDATGISGAREHKIVYLLCLLAALHVLIFSAAFPFFNNVDEEYHFDLVLKYASGHVPRQMESVGVEAAHYIALYRSPEYLSGPEYFQRYGSLPPRWLWPASNKPLQEAIAQYGAEWQNQINRESSQPPLYYALAGLWWDLGKGFGFSGRLLLYWLRFLDSFVIALSVLTAYGAAREIFPDNLFLKIGAPALLAFLPQSIFYSINNDILAPLCFGATLIYLVKWLRADVPRADTGMAAGFALAATFLVKISNLPLLIISFAAITIKTRQLAVLGKIPASWQGIIAIWSSALLPIIVWMTWCRINFGDLTGTEQKVHLLGWTIKAFPDWWSHPIFTFSGLWLFTFRLIGTFWRGEFIWHGTALYFIPADLIYSFVSIALVLMILVLLLRRTDNPLPLKRWILALLFACILSMYFYFAFLSVIYDFHDCVYPSRAKPYFTSGRLMLGGLIPFLLLFVFQLDRFLKRRSMTAKAVTLFFLIFLMLASEIATDGPVFSSQYNLYH